MLIQTSRRRYGDTEDRTYTLYQPSRHVRGDSDVAGGTEQAACHVCYFARAASPLEDATHSVASLHLVQQNGLVHLGDAAIRPTYCFYVSFYRKQHLPQLADEPNLYSNGGGGGGVVLFRPQILHRCTVS